MRCLTPHSTRAQASDDRVLISLDQCLNLLVRDFMESYRLRLTCRARFQIPSVPFRGEHMSLPITARQLKALRARQVENPELGGLASAIALVFDASVIENPHMARVSFEKTCRRIVLGQAGSHEALIKHLKHSVQLNCLCSDQVVHFSKRLRQIRTSLIYPPPLTIEQI